MSKKAPVLKINQAAEYQGGGGLTAQADDFAPPALGSMPAPTNLILLSVTSIRGIDPQAYINIQWTAPDHVTPEGYFIEYDFNDTFSNHTRVRTTITNAALLAEANTTYYIRVAAYYKQVVSDWSNVIQVVTPADITIPLQITNLIGVAQNGDMILTWSEPIDPAFRDARITVFNSTKSIIYGTYYSDTGMFVLTESENMRLSSNSGINTAVFEVTSRGWSGLLQSPALEATVTIPAPNAVTGVTTDFSTGDLFINWSTNNASDAFKSVIVSIYDTSAKTTKYRDISTRGTTTSWLVADNFADAKTTGHTLPDPSVYIEIVVQGYLNRYSTVASTTATKPLPATPASITHTWIGDTGLADEDVKFSWASVANIDHYEILINGKSYTTTLLELLYTFNMNGSDNSGVPDPTLTYQVRAVDRLLQNGALSTITTATNVAPPTSAFSIQQVTANWDTIGVFINQSAEIKDFKYWHVQVINSALTVVQDVKVGTNVIAVSVPSNDTYTVKLSAIDLFNQESTQLSQANIVINYLTITQLRADSTYTDDLGTPAVTLNLLKDNDFNGNGPSYSGTNVEHWIQFERPLRDRFGTITLTTFVVSGTATAYFATSLDGITWKYYKNYTTAANGLKTLTLATSQADAQSNPITLQSGVSFETTNTLTGAIRLALRLNFPTVVEAQYVKLFLKVNGTTVMREFFPRRLLQSDDIETETLTTINLAAGAVTAAKLAVTTLSSVNTSTGTLEVFEGGYIRSGQASYNNGVGYFIGKTNNVVQFSLGNSGGNNIRWDGTNLYIQGSQFTEGTITGTTIQTSVANPKVLLNSTGMATYDSLGNVQVQATTGTNGALTAGGGNVKLDNTGVYIVAPIASTAPQVNKLRWRDPNNNDILELWAVNISGTNTSAMLSTKKTTSWTQLLLRAESSSDYANNWAQIKLTGKSTINASVVSLEADEIQLSTTKIFGNATVSGNAFMLGQTGGNGDSYIRVNNPGGVSFLCLTGGVWQDPFSTSNIASGAQIILGGNQGLWPGHLYLQSGSYLNQGIVYIQSNNQIQTQISGSLKTILAANSLVWQAPALQNNWVNYGGGFTDAGYLIDANRIIHLRGLIRSGIVTAVIFTLAAGYRPTNTHIFPVMSNGVLGEVRVYSDGSVTAHNVNNTWVSLDGIRFASF